MYEEQKRVSKLVALALAATMLVGSASVVSAHETKDTTDISMLRGALCPNCGIGQMVLRYSSWRYNGKSFQNCIHYPHGQDEMHNHVRDIFWECTDCPTSQNGVQQHRTVLYECHGFR